LRNNSGALINPDNPDGPPVRFGLGNDSPQQNALSKSSDWIGIKRVVITQEMVGSIVGQFIALEIKKEGWSYKATKREVAQHNFMITVGAYGGAAQFATCPEDLVII